MFLFYVHTKLFQKRGHHSKGDIALKNENHSIVIVILTITSEMNDVGWIQFVMIQMHKFPSPKSVIKKDRTLVSKMDYP